MTCLNCGKTKLHSAVTQGCTCQYAMQAPPAAEQEPDQKRPQNCGTGYCSCIECVMKPSPRAWLIEFENGDEELHFDEQSVGKIHTPLYTTPPQRTWVDLTPQDLNDIFKTANTGEGAVYLALKIIRKKNLKEQA